MKRVEKTLVVILAVISIALLFIFFLYNKPHESITNATPDIYINATALADAFSSDEATANHKYLGKVLEVTGTIREVTHNNEAIVILLEGNRSSESISCTIQPDQVIQTTSLTLGKSITIRGICTGFLLEVVLVRCIIIKQKQHESSNY